MSSKSITPFLPMITMCLKRNDKRTDALKKKNERLFIEKLEIQKKKKKKKRLKFIKIYTPIVFYAIIYVSTHI